MIPVEKLRSTLYWLLLLQCCVISVSIAAASACLALSLLVLLIIVTKERRWDSYRTSLDVAFLAYIVIEFITAFTSEHQTDALKNAKRLLLISIVYGVFISFDERKKIERAVMILVGTVSVLSYFEVIFSLREGADRLTVFQHYMTTGGLKMIVSLLAIPFMLSKETATKNRMYFGFALAPVLVALLLTNTRSAWLGFLAGMIVMSALYYRKLFAAILLLVVLFFQFAPQHQIDRARSIVDITHPNNVGRLAMWSTGLRMWQDKPILGYGDIDLYTTYSRYRTPGIDEPAGHLHNNFIHLLVTIGTIGFCVVMFLFARIIIGHYTIFASAIGDPLVRNISLGGISIFTGFLVNGLFEWNFGDHEIMVFIWFSVGLVLAVGKVSGRQK